MAQGDFWQMGVAVPMANHSFRFGTEKQTTLNGNYTSGTTLTVDATTPALTNIFKAKDRVLVGPSTNTDAANTNHRETVQLTAVTATTFALKNALTYDYRDPSGAAADGDPVGGIGTQLAGAWDLGGSASASGIDGGGKDDDYAQKVNLGTTTSDYLEQSGLATLEVSTVYRVGCYLRSATGGSSDKIRVKVHDGSSYFIGAATSVSLDSKTSFTRYTDTGTTNATWTTLGAAAIRFIWMAGTPDDVEIDLVWLEHAKNTTTASSGFLTFTDKPDQGLQVSGPGQWQERRLKNQTARRYASSGAAEKTAKWQIAAHFSFMPQALWDNLMELKQWQDQGQFLTLQPFLDDVPPVLVGTMLILEDKPVAKSHWNLGLHSFDFIFTER
jgi:hypothetical protein